MEYGMYTEDPVVILVYPEQNRQWTNVDSDWQAITRSNGDSV